MISGRTDSDYSSADISNNSESVIGVGGKTITNQENLIRNQTSTIHPSNEVGGSTHLGITSVPFNPMNQQANFDSAPGFAAEYGNNFEVHSAPGRNDHSQSESLLRNQMNPSNLPINNFQMPFPQGQINLMGAQGPLLSSNGNYTTLNHMHQHNLTSTESFVAVPPQNMGHPTFMSQAAPTLNGNGVGLGQHNKNQPPANQSELRGSIISSHSSGGGQNQNTNEVHAVLQQPQISSQYLQVPNRNIQMANVPSQQIPMSMNTANNFPVNNAQPSVFPTNPSNSTMQNQIGHPPLNQPPAFPGRSTLPKGWHSADHATVRESMADEIVKLLKSRKPNAGENWHDKLPHMAKRLEDALYFDASSYDEYSDKNTLKQRLQQLALSMGSSKSLQQKNQVQNLPQQPTRGNQYPQTSHGPYMNSSQSNFPQGSNHMHLNQQQPMVNQNNNPQGFSHGQFMHGQRVPGPYQSNSAVANPTIGMPPYHSMNMDYSNQVLPNASRNGAGGMMHNPSVNIPDHSIDANSANGNMKGAPLSHQVGGLGDNGSGMMNHYSRGPLGAQNVSGGALQQGVPPPASHNMPQAMNANHPGSVIPPNSEEHRKQVLKQQQQRLLLLRHASKCPHENGRCPVTPHCWNMKQLWKHIMSCKDQECKVPHCVSSRYVLSHYSKCKEPTCPVCGPVREAIKRNYERSRDVVKMVRNPTQSVQGAIPAQVPNPAVMNISNHVPSNREEPPAKKQKKKHSSEDRGPLNPTQQQPTIVIRPPARKIYPLDTISSAIYSFSNEQIAAHFKSIHEGMRLTVNKIKDLCRPIIEDLFKIQHAQAIFGAPVDPTALGLVDYFDIVKLPMDLGTIIKRLESGSYRDLNNFVFDVHLTFDNAMLYNPKNSDVHCLAKNLKREFDSKFRAKINEFEKGIEDNRKNKDACLICGELSLKYEPPVYYCSGTCGQRIRRNAVFYANNSNSYHWCSPCFNALKESDVIKLPDCSISKAELASNKKKHTEESEEGWVECEGGCRRWVHQVCSLFNNRRNVSDDISYVCPLCLQEKRKKSPNEEIVAVTTKKMRAADLPVTTLSAFLERRIMKRLEMAYEEYAEKLGVSPSEVEKCPPLTLRQVSCLDKLQTVREGFYSRYNNDKDMKKEKEYPRDFQCRTKCLVLFQNIDGQDVILFGMYVYEYGDKCPQPNRRRVYISYLDSVHYLRPKQYRTIVYHEILISYLDYVKARGFHTAHIWACPPQKGDDYILYVHPPDQKTPKPQILRLWYDEMLKRCMERKVVCEVTDLHTEFLSDASTEATTLPYFEGDYWVNEAEVIIKSLTDGKRDDSSANDKSGGNKSKRKKSKASVKSWSVTTAQGERDPLMAKLASIIEPMKDTFFVARLHPREFADKLARQNDLPRDDLEKEQTEKELQEEALSAQDIVPQIPEMEKSTEDSGQDKESVDDEPDDFAIAAASVSSGTNDFPETSSSSVNNDSATLQATKQLESQKVDTSSSKLNTQTTPDSQLQLEQQKIADVHTCKRLILSGEDMPNLPDDTEDVDDIQECEHFDTRQSFLNLCQGNHYQFDQLRRAKHSSMMVLYHLHNPDAPKFVPTCSFCHIDILGNLRYRCEKCEVDFCQGCFSKVGSAIHSHPLRPFNSGAAPTMLTEEQRRERQRSIQLHMQLLLHAANCNKCDSKNCMKMKEFLAHEAQCKIKANGGCRLCSRISNLLNIHARSCRTDNCPVPYCTKLREQHRQLALSQQRMDDRRRKKMNSEYNRTGQQIVDDDD